MKNILQLSLILLSSFPLTHVHAQHSPATVAFNKIITAYLGVKDALAAGDGNQASGHAKDLLAAIQAMPEAQLTADQQKTWQFYGPKLEFDSRHISEVSKVPHQREHFTSLSANLYSALKTIPLNTTALYEEICTMTKHTFLSQSSTGKDPYMGMDNCSKVTATIPPAKP